MHISSNYRNIVVAEIDDSIGWKQDSTNVFKVIMVEKYKWRGSLLEFLLKGTEDILASE